jgi:importin subunit beta-1
VLAKIANIELPRGMWPDLVNNLLANMQQDADNMKQSTLEALGYICEEIVLFNLALVTSLGC